MIKSNIVLEAVSHQRAKDEADRRTDKSMVSERGRDEVDVTLVANTFSKLNKESP